MRQKKLLAFLLALGMTVTSMLPAATPTNAAEIIVVDDTSDEIEVDASQDFDILDESVEIVEQKQTTTKSLKNKGVVDTEDSIEIDRSAVESASSEDSIIAHFDFDGVAANDTLTGYGAKATGTYGVTEDLAGGKAISFDGKKQFLSLTKEDGSPIMTGLNEFTVSFEVKPSKTSTSWPVFINRDGDSPEGKQNYMGAFYNNASTLNWERYCNNNRADDATSTHATVSTSEWVHIDLVQKDGFSGIYANGELADSKNFDKDFFRVSEILGDNSIFNIGKATWGGGEYYGGYMDNFTLYSKALSEEEVVEEYKEFKTKLNSSAKETELSLNAGFVANELSLPQTFDGKEVTYVVSENSVGKVVINDYVATFTRSETDNEEVYINATCDGAKKAFVLTVLKEGGQAASYVSKKPIEGQGGGMKLAVKDSKEDKFTAVHKDQPIMYTAKGGKAYVKPSLFRKKDGTSFGMVAGEKGAAGKVLLYDSADLISYTNEREVTLTGCVASVLNVFMVYDQTDDVYKLFAEDAYGKQYRYTSSDLAAFTGGAYPFAFEEALSNVPADAMNAVSIDITKDEQQKIIKKFTNPAASSIEFTAPTEVTVNKATDLRAELNKLADETLAKIKYSYADETGYDGGKEYNYKIHWNNTELASLESAPKGEYTIHGYVGGDSYYVEADDPLISERADPYITYDDVTGMYMFTASYPMYGSGDKEGYDRLVLRMAPTVDGLATADEITIWDEKDDSSLFRFIWAPEIHKINGTWYFISTASIDSNKTPNFSIRPFMIKFNGDPSNVEEIQDPSKWGKATLVKAMSGDEKNVLNGMSLDMTYFEAGGKHYLAWPDETKTSVNPNGLSAIFIATIDPADPTQLTSKASLVTMPEYSWELVRYSVNEGPAALISNDGKTVYLAFSAAGTGSEYSVGYLYADVDADLTDPSNWTKCPYPILTSGDFNDELSGPGHNSFTKNANGEPIICFHARPAAAHATLAGGHAGDPLYDPCRSAYIRPVFYDVDGVPILNLSDEDFAGENGSEFEVKVTIETDDRETINPILEYTFDKDDMSEDKIANKAEKVGSTEELSLDAISHGAKIVEDKEQGSVLYLDGDKSVYGGNNSYLEFPANIFDGRDEITISMDVNEITKKKSYQTFSMGRAGKSIVSMKIAPTSLQASLSAVGGETKTALVSGAYPNMVREWVNVKIVITPKAIKLYRDGKLVATKTGTNTPLSEMGSDFVAYLGKSFASSDIYFRGYFDNVKVYPYAMSDKEAAKNYEAEQAALKAELQNVKRVAELYEIPNKDDIRGNITLPTEIDGVSISWKSSNERVISTKVVANRNYDSTPAGVVKRQSADTNVKLTATFTKEGQESVVKDYDVTVKKAPAPIKDEDYAAYLFVRFVDTQQTQDKEQTYFSISRDGRNWKDLNGGQPIEELKSTMGESGTRDHFIARTPEGDKFYMIATDLSIFNNRNGSSDDWGDAGGNGSNAIFVAESLDLVNWSEPWLVDIAPENKNFNPGCTWAPEFQYDYETGEYVVFWASTGLEVDDDGNITQNYENHTMYYAKTRDFRTFTEAKVFKSGGKANGKIVKVIDSTMIRDGSWYYRYTKNESTGNIMVERANKILGTFEPVESTSLSVDVPNSVGATEGPIIYKMNKKDSTTGKNQWCLMIDRFARDQGYYPLIADDLSTGIFRQLTSSEYSMQGKYRHGYVMPITETEYKAIQGKWGTLSEYYPTTSIDKSNSGNPMLGFDADGNILYGGDPSILVDGDTVYAYVGEDASKTAGYNMPGWKCYSSTDMKNWKFESTILTCDRKNVTWAADDVSAWAGQVMKYKDKYYFYFCTETNSKYGGGKSIGVAVSDSPTGPFTDIGHPLVRNIDTYDGVSTWEDIDPTAWIETDENGVEHRVLGWGNSRFFNCELNEDMISIKDKDGDSAKISAEKAADKEDADIKVGVIEGLDGHVFTEAPYYYRQQDKNGKYYGNYYMFFAVDWREQMGYAYAETFDQFIRNEWKFGGILMDPSCTSNTNHMAVFDFKGQTYFVYHDGSLPWGSGFRRVACVEKFSVNPDGSIDPIRKTATGLTGTLSQIKDADGNFVASTTFENTLNDADYSDTDDKVKRYYHYADTVVDYLKDGVESGWEINEGRYDRTNEAYVSIESDYKPGMYLSAGYYGKSYGNADEIPVYIAQDVLGTVEEAQRITFKTLKGFDESVAGGITFESVIYPGYFLASRNGKLVLAKEKNFTNKEATFSVGTFLGSIEGKAIAEKSVRMYKVGDTLDASDIRAYVKFGDAKVVKAKDITTNATSIDMSTVGNKKLKVEFTCNGVGYSVFIPIKVVSGDYYN